MYHPNVQCALKTGMSPQISGRVLFGSEAIKEILYDMNTSLKQTPSAARRVFCFGRRCQQLAVRTRELLELASI